MLTIYLIYMTLTDMIPFNYHHLYYFYVIAKEGSISKATHQLHLAQPTLSTQLKQFENFLNVKLFIRENRNLILTEEGHRVLEYAKMIFDIGRELKDRMVDLNKKGRLRIQIGVPNSIPKTIIEALLSHLLNIHPTVFLVVTEDKINKLIKDLDNHELDLILTDTPFQSPGTKEIKNHFIGKIPIVFCVHPKLSRRFKNMPKDLNGAAMLLPASSRQIFQTLQEYFIENNIEPNIVGEIEDIEIVRRLALRGVGVAPLNLLTALRGPSKEKLVVLNRSSKQTIFENFYLITKTRKIIHPLVEKLIRDFRIEKFITKI